MNILNFNTSEEEFDNHNMSISLQNILRLNLGCQSSNCGHDYILIAEACLCLRVKSEQPYDNAKQSCLNDGAQLIRIESPLKQTYLQQYLSK